MWAVVTGIIVLVVVILLRWAAQILTEKVKDRR